VVVPVRCRFDRYLDFTTDPAAYPGTAMAAWLETLHNTRGQHYVHIIDPGISSTQGVRAHCIMMLHHPAHARHAAAQRCY